MDDDTRHAIKVLNRPKIGPSKPLPPPQDRDAEGEARLLACVRKAVRGSDEQTVTAGLVLLWTSQHLDNLRRLEGRLAEHARTAHGLAPH